MKLARLSALALAIAVTAPAALAEAPRPASTTTASSPPCRRPSAPGLLHEPRRAPCQLQDRILQDMAPELKGKAEVVYYKTTVAATSRSSSSTASDPFQR